MSGWREAQHSLLEELFHISPAAMSAAQQEAIMVAADAYALSFAAWAVEHSNNLSAIDKSKLLGSAPRWRPSVSRTEGDSNMNNILREIEELWERLSARPWRAEMYDGEWVIWSGDFVIATFGAPVDTERDTTQRDAQAAILAVTHFPALLRGLVKAAESLENVGAHVPGQEARRILASLQTPR